MDRCFTDLARTKAAIKRLEGLAKRQEAKCIAANGAPGKVETKYGTLVYNTRESWKIIDKAEVIKVIGEGEFLKRATISVTKIKEVVGEQGVSDLEEDGAVEFTGVTQWYSFKD